MFKEGDQDEEPKRGRGRPKGSGKQKFNLTPAQLSMGLAFVLMFVVNRVWPRIALPAEAKPLAEEMDAFTTPAASIILRHTPPIAASPDILDLFKMGMAGWRWYLRVKPLVEATQAQRAGSAQGQQEEIEHGEETERSNGRVRIVGGTTVYGRRGLYAGDSVAPA